MAVFVCVFALFFVFSSSSSASVIPESYGPFAGQDLKDFFKWNNELPSMNLQFSHFLEKTHSRLNDLLTDRSKLGGSRAFQWIPEYIGSVPIDGTSFQWNTPCFGSVVGHITNSSTFELTISASEPTGDSTCVEDFYLIGVVSALHLETFTSADSRTIVWREFSNQDMQWIGRNGFRIFRFPDDRTNTVEELLSTVELFFPAYVTATIPLENQLRNVEFLKEYAYYNMTRRVITDVILDETQINSGDFFAVIRLDGLDPTLAWAMGAHTGHTTIAMWIHGELFVCESTTNSAYWPTNGIQKTPYRQWIAQAKNASYNVIHLPLSPAAQAQFNATQALEWLENTAFGLPYGFHNMLFAWIDTAEANYPGFLVSQSHELLVGWADTIAPMAADLLWNSAFNMRLGTQNLSTVECYLEAYSKGLTFESLFALPEQDDWLYNDYHEIGPAKGYSMVCDVLVCETWKAGGLFGNLTDQIQCTEFTNWDAYSLDIFDTNYVRPAECQLADPDMPYCQILGEFRMSLPFYNTRPMVAGMAQDCPRGTPPDWAKPAGC